MTENQTELQIKEEYNEKCFDSMMDTLFDLANQLHSRSKLTKVEGNFLAAFDEYVNSANVLNDLEDENKWSDENLIESLIRIGKNSDGTFNEDVKSRLDEMNVKLEFLKEGIRWRYKE